MKTYLPHSTLLVLSILGALGGVRPLRADLIADLDVNVTQETGQYLYEYTLTNDANSDLPVVAYLLSVPASVELVSIAGPLGWLIVYEAGDSAVSWESTEPVTDLLPGQSAGFSFRSSQGPGLGGYLIVGLDEVNQRLEFIEGEISGPGASAVPEPATLTLFSLGGLGLLGYRLRGRRTAV